MKHPADGRLNDYVDGLLEESAVARMERHLDQCTGCRERVARLRRLEARLESLPDRIRPRRDLRPGIRQRLRSKGAARGRAGGRSWATRRRWLRTAAIVALLAIGGVGVWLGVGSDRGASSDSVIGEYARATDDLTTTLRTHRHELSPEAARALDRSLATVDAAIRELERADETDSDRELERHLEHRYQTKLELLRRAMEMLEDS